MPPSSTRPISAFFTKLPATPKSGSAAAARAASGASTSTSTSASAIGSSAAPRSGPSTSPLTAGSSPVTPTASTGTKKRAGLSDAAKQAIRDAAAGLPENGDEDGSERPASKRLKLDAPPVADVFSKAATTKAPRLSGATSREDVRAALSADARTAELLRTEVDTLGEDWLLALQDEITKPYFLSLKEFVTAQQASKKIFPPSEDVYSWSRLCPLKDVRVVIIGQDPYHDDNQAHGLAFSVRRNIRIPPSLRNIYKQMHTDVPGFIIPKHGDLTEWAKHGVLLLNTSLTVRAHEAGSHAGKGWEQFTAAVLRVVTARLAPEGGTSQRDGEGHEQGANGVCFMAWGAHAQKMCAGVDAKKHLILKSAHPSPLAASRGFFGNGHFVKANEWLEERYGPGGGIDWAALGDRPAV